MEKLAVKLPDHGVHESARLSRVLSFLDAVHCAPRNLFKYVSGVLNGAFGEDIAVNSA